MCIWPMDALEMRVTGHGPGMGALLNPFQAMQKREKSVDQSLSHTQLLALHNRRAPVHSMRIGRKIR